MYNATFIVPPDNACSELPPLENGGVVYSDLNLPPGTEGRYICNEGYTMHTDNGRKQFTCTEDGVWDGEIIEVPVQCVCKLTLKLLTELITIHTMDYKSS